MTDLKPCPFCGGEAELDFAHKTFHYTDEYGECRDTGLMYTVRCRDIYCGCSIGTYKVPEMAKTAWNRRKGDGND